MTAAEDGTGPTAKKMEEKEKEDGFPKILLSSQRIVASSNFVTMVRIGVAWAAKHGLTSAAVLAAGHGACVALVDSAMTTMTVAATAAVAMDTAVCVRRCERCRGERDLLCIGSSRMSTFGPFADPGGRT
jgi:hypothetical protein